MDTKEWRQISTPPTPGIEPGPSSPLNFRILILIVRPYNFMISIVNILDQGRSNCGPRAPFLWPASAKWIYWLFLVWLPVTRINCLARFKYDWGYTNVIPSKRRPKAKQRGISDRFVYKRVVKMCGLFLMMQFHPRPPHLQIIYPYVSSTIDAFPLLCVVHLPVFLSFSVSLLVSYAVSGALKSARYMDGSPGDVSQYPVK